MAKKPKMSGVGRIKREKIIRLVQEKTDVRRYRHAMRCLQKHALFPVLGFEKNMYSGAAVMCRRIKRMQSTT